MIYSTSASRISATTASTLRPSRIARAVSRSMSARASVNRKATSTRSGRPGTAGRFATAAVAICSGVRVDAERGSGVTVAGGSPGRRGRRGMRRGWHRTARSGPAA